MNADKKIWNEFRKGENHALSTIYLQHVHLLYRYGSKFTSDNEMVKDVIQDMFIDLINNRDNLGETNNICFYLMTSFRRRLARSMSRNTNVIFSGDANFSADIVYSAEQELIDKENLTIREQKVKNALASLSPRQREILFYKFFCDFSYEQICEIMELQYDSARKQTHRALKAMKEILFSADTIMLFFSFFTFRNKPH